MNDDYVGEPLHEGESAIGHEIRNLCGYLVHLVSEVDPKTDFGHLVHDLEVAEASLMEAH